MTDDATRSRAADPYPLAPGFVRGADGIITDTTRSIDRGRMTPDRAAMPSRFDPSVSALYDAYAVPLAAAVNWASARKLLDEMHAEIEKTLAVRRG